MNTAEEIRQLAEQHGLAVRGGFEVANEDNVPDIRKGTPAVALVLFGNAGSSSWESFSNSEEYADGAPDPLNRWSERIGNQMAAEFGGRAYFPFGGPPYQPFIRWASKAESLRSSKIGSCLCCGVSAPAGTLTPSMRSGEWPWTEIPTAGS